MSFLQQLEAHNERGEDGWSKIIFIFYNNSHKEIEQNSKHHITA